MASTKKPIISKESIDKLNELKTIDELYREYDREIIKEQEVSEKDKNAFINNIINNGERLFDECESLKNQRLEQKNQMIQLILKKSKKYKSYNQLVDYSNEELFFIISELNEEKNSFFKKILKFFNL